MEGVKKGRSEDECKEGRRYVEEETAATKTMSEEKELSGGRKEGTKREGTVMSIK